MCFWAPGRRSRSSCLPPSCLGRTDPRGVARPAAPRTGAPHSRGLHREPCHSTPGTLAEPTPVAQEAPKSRGWSAPSHHREHWGGKSVSWGTTSCSATAGLDKTVVTKGTGPSLAVGMGQSPAQEGRGGCVGPGCQLTPFQDDSQLPLGGVWLSSSQFLLCLTQPRAVWTPPAQPAAPLVWLLPLPPLWCLLPA